MANKKLFAPAGKAVADRGSAEGGTRHWNCMNEAGGRAYAFSPEHALAQYAVTGTLHGTYYATDDEQLEKLLGLAAEVPTEFVAKTALYCRERGFMKDVPALLAAWLSAHDRARLAAIFPRVIDGGRMLRTFVQIVRSGVVGRRSLGSAPKRLVRRWFETRSPEAVFRNSLGNDPSMADVIKLARPAPKNERGEIDLARRALYGWLIGRDVAHHELPPVVQAFEAYKRGETKELPDVPFEMLTALPLDAEAWAKLATRMSWTQLRMSLATLARHRAFDRRDVAGHVAAKLRDPREVRRARAFPYQLLAAWKAAGKDVPGEVALALQQAMEIAIENVPSFAAAGPMTNDTSTKVVLCPDVSGSMHSPITGRRGSATTSVRCVDVAALVAAAFLRRNPSAEVLPFSDDVITLPRPLNPLDAVVTNAELLASLPSGGTACVAPLRALNARGARADLVVYVSDNQSWVDFASGGGSRGTPMAQEWARFRTRNPSAKLVLVDLQPYASTQVSDDASVLNVGGFSDRVFEIIALFARGDLGGRHFVDEIASISL
jgi:60 kDa SS-A/Ro ribonucleoprotein